MNPTPAHYAEMARLWPTRKTPWPKCRGTAGDCANTPGRDGFCSVCHKRVVTLVQHGYDATRDGYRVGYAKWITDRPSAAPKPNRKKRTGPPPEVSMTTPAPLPTIWTEDAQVAFPAPPVPVAKAPEVEESPVQAPMWAAQKVSHPSPLMSALALVAGECPCPHDAYDGGLGDGATWRKCMDCGTVFEAAFHDRCRARAAAFDDALTMLRAALSGPVVSSNTSREEDARTIDTLRLEVATLHALLKNPDHLRAQLARMDARSSEIATLKARLAELENE